MGPTRRKIPSWVTTTFGYVLSLACLIWVLRGMTREQITEDIQSLNWWYIVVAVIFDLSVYVAHGWRWNTLLRPVARLSLWRTTQSIYIGLFANELLPLRVGEVIRCYLLAHWNDLHLSVVIASAGIERILDGFWMIVAFIVTASFMKLPKPMLVSVQIMGGALLIAAILFIWIMRYKEHSHAVVTGSRWGATLRHVIEGLHSMGNPRTMWRSALVSLLYFVLQIVPIWAVMKAYQMDLSFWAGAAVLVMIRFGTVVPNAPGNVGLYQAVTVLAMGLLGVDRSTAANFSFVMWIALTLPLLIGGSVALALTGLKLGDIKTRAKRGLEHTEEVPD